MRQRHADGDHRAESQGGEARWVVAVSEWRSGEYAGRGWLGDLLGQRRQFAAGMDVQAARLRGYVRTQVSSTITEGGPNGVAVASGVVYGDTTTTVFALNARTGKTIWVDGDLLGSG